MRRISSALFPALQASLPVFFGYISIGIAFGFLLVKSGLSWFWAPLMSLTVYAGAAQFLAVGLLAGGKSPLEMGLAVLLVNARHMVYGFSLLERFKPYRNAKAYLIFGLTDETYGLLTTVKPPASADPKLFDLFLTALNQSYWVAGSVIGSLLGMVVPGEARGIEFSMTALFTVLLVEQIRSLKSFLPFVVPAVLCLVLFTFGFGSQALLLGVVGSTVVLFLIPKRSLHG